MMRSLFLSIICTALLLIVFVQVATPIIHPQTHILPVHKTLYLDRRMDDEEVLYILLAAIEWNEATDGQVIFDLQRMPASKIDVPNSIIVVNVTPDYPEIMLLDNVNDFGTIGYSHSTSGLSYIGLVDDRLDDNYYMEAVLHELGHSLGMEHIEGMKGIGTLMYPSAELGSKHITKTDLFYFCKLYHCDSRKFHGIP